MYFLALCVSELLAWKSMILSNYKDLSKETITV